jgi:hypothetical protein
MAARMYRPRNVCVLTHGKNTDFSLLRIGNYTVIFYIRAAYKYLSKRFVLRGKTRKAMFLLLGVQVVIVAINIALIVIDFEAYICDGIAWLGYCG